jgi:DNA replication and repair protein RecF
LTEKLIKEAKVLIIERQKFVDNINKYLKKLNYEISDDKDEGKITYFPNRTDLELEKSFIERKTVDLALKTTTIGPHRDDFEPEINGKNAYSFSSSGQQRTLSLALKLALAAICKEKNEKLIIILDDVFSELDSNRQNQIMKLLYQGNQIFITTTSIDVLSKNIIENSKIMKISKEETNER